MIGLLYFSACCKRTGLPQVDIISTDFITHSSIIIKCNAVSDGGSMIVEKGICWSEISPATLNDYSSERGSQDTGKYCCPMLDLKPGETYYVSAYAKNNEGIAYSKEVTVNTLTPEFLIDPRDNQSYPIITIGDTYWMAGNLNFHTPDGSWYYENDSIQNSVYGRLYTWNLATSVCPEGWRLPLKDDWTLLLQSINTTVNFVTVCEALSSNKLKMPGLKFWQYESDSVTNGTGFSALAAGIYDNVSGKFHNIKIHSVFWCQDTFDDDAAWFYRLEAWNNDVCQNYANKESGFSVRCIKDK